MSCEARSVGAVSVGAYLDKIIQRLVTIRPGVDDLRVYACNRYVPPLSIITFSEHDGWLFVNRLYLQAGPTELRWYEFPDYALEKEVEPKIYGCRVLEDGDKIFADLCLGRSVDIVRGEMICP